MELIYLSAIEFKVLKDRWGCIALKGGFSDKTLM